jgi:hypothetical protein
MWLNFKFMWQIRFGGQKAASTQYIMQTFQFRSQIWVNSNYGSENNIFLQYY